MKPPPWMKTKTGRLVSGFSYKLTTQNNKSSRKCPTILPYIISVNIQIQTIFRTTRFSCYEISLYRSVPGFTTVTHSFPWHWTLWGLESQFTHWGLCIGYTLETIEGIIIDGQTFHTLDFAIFCVHNLGFICCKTIVC